MILTFNVAAQTDTPQATATPSFSMFPYTIAGLQAGHYPGGTINIRSRQSMNSEFTGYYVDYPSDGLTITAMLHIPTGDGPYPVVILLHGYYDRENYRSGLGTRQAAEYLSRNGYITIAPDFRTWGESDIGINMFATGLVSDTLNLISSLPSIPQADSSRVGIWGHSMGGGVATKALTVDDRIRAGVLYAPNSANDADLIERWGAACYVGRGETAIGKCNPAEVVLYSLPEEIVDAYFSATSDPTMLQAIAPIYHLNNVTAPIQIHIGTEDGQLLVQTPPEWSENLYLALEAAAKEVEYYTYPNQGHFFRGQSWEDMMQRTVDFFDTHLTTDTVD